jgi:cyanophycin synthetase
VAALAELCDGDVILYGLQGADGPAQAIAQHLTQGGKAVLANHEGQCFLCTGMPASAPHYLPLNGLAMLCNGEKAPWSTDALLPTIAAAWAMGMSPTLISKGLETFHLQAS